MTVDATAIWPATVTWYDITLKTPAENLALDEALLLDLDAHPSQGILRTWEPNDEFVVVGRSNQVATEVDVGQCRSEGVPIFRRASGGGTVLIGRGCLGFALILPLTEALRAGGVTLVTRRVMERIASELAEIVPGVEVCGTSDLVRGNRKFSGNSQRWLRQAFLHHGTILFDFDLPRIGHLLKKPSRQPDYRSGRIHDEFVANVNAPRNELLRRLVAAWNGQSGICPANVLRQAQSLAVSRYERDDWNFER